MVQSLPFFKSLLDMVYIVVHVRDITDIHVDHSMPNQHRKMMTIIDLYKTWYPWNEVSVQER